MKTYHKIQTVYKRDPDTKFKTLLDKEFSLPEFEFLRNNEWVFTEKVNGTNIRIMFADDIEFRGKTDRAEMPAQLIKKLEERFLPQLKIFKDTFPEGVCLYGEGYGPKIQKGGGNYREDQDFVLFDVKIEDWWLQRKDVEGIAIKLGLDIVPVLSTGTLPYMVSMVQKGFNSTWGEFIAEGIVARPATELKTRSNHRIITKVKCKDFLR